MKKSFEIAAKINTDDFDKDIEKMQKKLKELYAPADAIRAQANTSGRLQQQGFGGIMSGPSQDAFQKATQQQRRDLEAMIREQATGQEKLGKQIAKRVDKVKELKNEQSELIKGSEKELAIKEKIARVEENTSKMRELYKTRDASLNQSLNTRANPPGMPAYPATGGGGYNGPPNTTVNSGWGMGLFGGLGNVIKTGASYLGGAGALIGGASNMYRAFGNAPIQTAGAMGSAVQGTIGRDVGNAYNGRTAFEGLFNPERMKALGMAKNAMDVTRTSDKGDLLASVLKQGAVGAGAGALGGSFVPGIGTAAGAVVGGLGGVLNGAFGDSRRRSLALSPFSNTMNKQYEATLYGEYANNYSTSYQGLKDSNPLKKFAMEDFEKNSPRNLAAKRAMGLTDDQFTGDNGYLKGVTNAGFTHDQGIGMSNSILGAGGSSRMARESGFGLQMERMGLTNAGSMLGSLSGSIQSTDSTKRATIEIMSSAMKAGLDSSNFAEENRKFTSAAANIISRTGATGAGDQERISQLLGQFLGERTNSGVSSAGNAYESFQQRGSQLEGRRGTLRMVEAMKDPNLSKLGQNDLSELLGMRPEDLNENNPELQAFAQKTGSSVKDVIDSVNKANRGGRYELPGQKQEVETYSSKIKAYMKSSGKSSQQIIEGMNNGTLDKGVMSDMGNLQIAMRRGESSQYNRSDMNAAVGEEIGGDNSFLGPLSAGNVLKDSMNTASRKEDKFNQGAAGDSEFVRKNFNDMSGEMDKAADAAAKMTQAVRQMALEFQEATAKADATKTTAPLDAWMTKFSTMGSTQPQAGKDSR